MARKSEGEKADSVFQLMPGMLEEIEEILALIREQGETIACTTYMTI
jgi:hypothetical protein